VPALPKTLHGLQGITADPGLIAHFEVPNVSAETKWLAYYVMLSRVRSLVYQNDKFWKVFHQRLCKKLWLNCLKARLRPRLKVARKRGPNLVGQKKGAQYGMIV